MGERNEKMKNKERKGGELYILILYFKRREKGKVRKEGKYWIGIAGVRR